jgi:hypothetical protein
MARLLARMTGQVQQDAAEGLGVSPNLSIFPQEWGNKGVETGFMGQPYGLW